jgi:hypothetical protein
MTTLSGLVLLTVLLCLGAVIIFRFRRDKTSGAAKFLFFALLAIVIVFVLWLLMMVVVVGPAMRAM